MQSTKKKHCQHADMPTTLSPSLGPISEKNVNGQSVNGSMDGLSMAGGIGIKAAHEETPKI